MIVRQASLDVQCVDWPRALTHTCGLLRLQAGPMPFVSSERTSGLYDSLVYQYSRVPYTTYGRRTVFLRPSRLLLIGLKIQSAKVADLGHGTPRLFLSGT